MGAMSTALTMAEAVPLGYVLCDRVARNAGIRLLAIKGPVLAQQGLRSERMSADVDVWIDPAAHGAFVAAMASAGWMRGPVSSAPTILPPHSQTLRHEAWPLEIDAHDRFPGFLAPVQDVFEVLWEHRMTVTLSGAPVITPDLGSHAAVVALHHLRDPQWSVSAPALDALVEHVKEVAQPADLKTLVEVARATGAMETLTPFLIRVGAPTQTDEPPSADRVALRQWEIRTGATGSMPWLMGLSQTPVWRWPGAIWHAIWLSDAEIDAFHARPDDSRLRARLRRLRRGLSQLPSAVAGYLRARREHGDHPNGNGR